MISSSADGSIKIFSQNNFEVQLTINEHQKEINSFTLLNDDRIISCSDDTTMKVIKLIGQNSYNVEQILNKHTDHVYKIVELKKIYLFRIRKTKL